MARDPVYKNKSRSRQILDYQLSQGQGRLKAGAMSQLKYRREQLSLLKGFEGSWIAGMLPWLDPYKATPRRNQGGSGGGLGTQEIVNKISELGDSFDRVLQKTIDTSIHTKNVAKYTSVLPRMASDNNITRKNIQRIAKVLGARPSNKADRYFQNFDVREREYESRFRRERGSVRDTPTRNRRSETDSGRGGGILSKLLGVVGKGVGLAALGAGIGGFLYGISVGIGSLNKMGGASGLKDLLVNLAEGLKAFDAQGLAIMGTLLVGGALFGRYAGGPLGIKTIGGGLGITAIGAGLGGFMAAMSLAATYSSDNGRSAKELMTNIAEGFKSFDVNSMIAMGALVGVGGLFGAYEGGKLASKDGLKALGAFGGAVLGITAVGLGIGGFMAAMSSAASLSTDNGVAAKEIMINFAAGMNALGGVNMAILGGIMALGGSAGALAGFTAVSSGGVSLLAAIGAVGGIAGVGGAIGLFMAALSGAASLSKDKGEAARDILVNLATGLNAFGAINGDNIMKLGSGFKALGEGLGSLFAQDIFDRIRKYFTGTSSKETFTALAENLKLLEKINGANLFNLGNGLHHLSLGLKNLASLTKNDLENINNALGASANVPQNVTAPSVPTVPKPEAKPEVKSEPTVPTKVPSLEEQEKAAKLAGNAYSTLVNAKRPQAEIDAALKNFEAQARKLEEMKQSAVPGKAERVDPKVDNAPKGYAEKVAQRESGANYNTTYGKAGNALVNGKPITENTVGEVIEWQRQMRATGKNVHAAGKYQIMDVANAAKLANIPLDAKFDGPTQEKMMESYTKENARILKSMGIEPTESNLALSHAVGAGGLQKLLNAESSGRGNEIAADVLGLKGKARDTNPHLVKKTVNEYLAELRKAHGNGTPSVLAQGPESTVPKQESPTKQESEKESKSVFSSIFDKVKSGTSGLFGMMNMENLKNMIPEFLKDAGFSAAEYGGDLRDYIFGKNAPVFQKLSEFQKDVGSPEIVKKVLDNITGVAKISGDDLSGLSEMLTQNKEDMMMRSGQENEVVKSPINIPTAIPDNTTASTAWAPVVNTDHMGYFMKWQSTSYALI